MISIEAIAEQQEVILSRLWMRQRDLVKYNQTIDDLRRTDVSKNIGYQRNYNGLYMVRRNAVWRTVYFSLLESIKLSKDIRFRDVLTHLHRATGRIEASFASKLIATIDPKRPVYDSFVRINFGMRTRVGPPADRINALCQDYDIIDRTLSELCKHPAFAVIRRTFDKRLPNCINFSDVKVLDVMIWQMR